MNIATLVVEGSAGSLLELLQALPLSPDAQWQAGEKTRAGHVHGNCGFSVTIADAESPADLLLELHAFIQKAEGAGVNFKSLTLSADLSVGVTVGDDEQFVATLKFPPELLASFADCNVGLSVTAYPTSEGANAT